MTSRNKIDHYCHDNSHISPNLRNKANVFPFVNKNHLNTYNYLTESTNQQEIDFTFLKAQIEKQREQQALKTCLLVEQCLHKIELKVKGFFAELVPKLEQVINLMLDSRGKSLEVILEENLFSAVHLNSLLDEVHNTIQNNLTDYFGKSLPLIMSVERQELGVNLYALEQANAEFSRTLSIVRHSERICNELWSMAVSSQLSSSVLDNVMDRVDFGVLIIKLVNVESTVHQKRCVQELKSRLWGMLQNIQSRLYHALSREIVESVYQLHEQVFEAAFEQELMRIKEIKEIKERHRNEEDEKYCFA